MKRLLINSIKLDLFALGSQPIVQEDELNDFLSNLQESDLNLINSFHSKVLSYFFKKIKEKDCVRPSQEVNLIVANLLENLTLLQDKMRTDAYLNDLTESEFDFVLANLNSSESNTKERLIDFFLEKKKQEYLNAQAKETEEINNLKNEVIKKLQLEILENREKEAELILKWIVTSYKKEVKKEVSEADLKVLRTILPDRLRRLLALIDEFIASKDLRRIELIFHWFILTHIVSNYEFKVEHWQIDTAQTEGTGVYKAGIDFSRFDLIIRQRDNNNLYIVSNEDLDLLTKKIVDAMRRPTKKAFQEIGQQLTLKTGYDQFTFFTK